MVEKVGPMNYVIYLSIGAIKTFYINLLKVWVKEAIQTSYGEKWNWP